MLIMKIVLSIPVHEKKEVIKDQISNILFYIEQPIIVLHVSADFYEKERGCFHEICGMENVYINPMHYPVKWGDIAHVHISNFNFIKAVIGEFDYFIIHASNDMYIKKGIENYIKRYDAGIQRRILKYEKSMWWPCERAWKDEKLKEIMERCKARYPVGTQVEGCFFRKEIFERIVTFLYDFESWEEADYTREEIYFSTVLYHIVSEEKIGYPTTFSEVHRYDRGLWKLERLLYSFSVLPLIRTVLSGHTYEKLHCSMVELYRKRAGYGISIRDIKKIRKHQTVIPAGNQMKDYPGEYRLYDGNIFSVKRVPRDFNHPLRIYIRRIMHEDSVSQRILEGRKRKKYI